MAGIQSQSHTLIVFCQRFTDPSLFHADVLVVQVRNAFNLHGLFWLASLSLMMVSRMSRA